MEVPLLFVPCQYQVTPFGAEPFWLIVTEAHCGELLVSVVGVVTELTVITVLAQVELQRPLE